MKLAFSLFKYFPFGGLQRDFMRIALECQQRGHSIRVYVLSWQGDVPPGFDVITVPVRALANHVRDEKFVAWVGRHLRAHPADQLIGFNKVPGLDVYYAADACYEDKARNLRKSIYRWSPRYRHFARFEQAVFGVQSATRVLMIAEKQIPVFQQYYGTPRERMYLLPPGIARDRRAPPNSAEVRAGLRAEFALADSELLLVQIGSGFKTKGLDRTLSAMAALPEAVLRHTHLIVMGQDDAAPFVRQAAALGLSERVRILAGRSDVPRFLLGADLLMHPAYNENTGTVLLEAMVAGLPVITTAACGYAHYVTDAGAGKVIADPFAQETLNAALVELLEAPEHRARCKQAGLAFADSADIYSMPERAADVILKVA
ncbi:MAG: glycosyltransferase family 4 protein [Rhodocyclaceae bacterium]|nr:glycosyltransferase family 4 protein [Rhodocyclaceae bacterium]